MTRILAAAVLFLLLDQPAPAMGPRMNLSAAVWDQVEDPAVTGYWLYWGTEGGFQHYASVAKDSRAGSNPAPSVDLMAVIPEAGTYTIAVTAHDAYMNESDFSNSITWARQVISAPGGFQVTGEP